MKREIAIAIDIESRFDGDKEHPRGAHSLKSMSTVEYIRDARWEFHMMSVVCPDLGIPEASPLRIVGHGAAQAFFDRLAKASEFVDFRLVGNNSGFFDALVFKEKFGYTFHKHFDVMTVAGWAFGNRLKDKKLETIASYMELPGNPAITSAAYAALGITADMDARKVAGALSAVKGKSLAEIAALPNLLEGYGLYCDLDAILSWQAYKRLAPRTQAHVLSVADLYYESYLSMPLEVDVELLTYMRDDYEATRDQEIAAFGQTAKALDIPFDGLKSIRSKDKFAKLLRDLGVPEWDVPKKPSPKKVDAQGNAEMIYAFGKTDLMLEAMVERLGDEIVAEAVRLRLEYNSSATISKLKRFGDAGKTGAWAFHVKPFGAANTARHSGGNGTASSPQNLKRAKPTTDLSCGHSVRWLENVGVRDAIGAPDGYELAVCDLSGIEMRVSLTLAGDQKYMAILRDPHNDVYCVTASDLYERVITKKDKAERFLGKLAELSLSYLTGPRKLHHTAAVWGNPIPYELAQLAHAKYRMSHPPVVEAWNYLEWLLERWALKDHFADGENFSIYEVTSKGLRSPSGFLIQYPDLIMERVKVGRSTQKRFHYWNASRRCRTNTHAGSVLENCAQSAAGAVFNDMHLRVDRRAKLEVQGQFVGSVHDEMIYRVRTGHGAEMLAIMQQEMCVPPVWWPELPVTSEGDFGYGILEYAPGQFKVVSRYGLLK